MILLTDLGAKKMAKAPGRTKWVLTGYFMGRHISATGFYTMWDALNYGKRKGWEDVHAIRDFEPLSVS